MRRRVVVKIICILSVFWISTAIYGQEEQQEQEQEQREELGSQPGASRASLFELYTTLSRAYLDIKRLDKEIKKLKKELLYVRRRSAAEKLKLHRRIDSLINDKKDLVKAYERKKASDDIFSIVLKVQGSHKEVEPLIELSVRPLDDLSIYAQIGMGYIVETKRLELNYKIGLSYKLFGI